MSLTSQLALMFRNAEQVFQATRMTMWNPGKVSHSAFSMLSELMLPMLQLSVSMSGLYSLAFRILQVTLVCWARVLIQITAAVSTATCKFRNVGLPVQPSRQAPMQEADG